MMTWAPHFVFQKQRDAGSIKLLKMYPGRQSLLREKERTNELQTREFQQSNASVEKVSRVWGVSPGGQWGGVGKCSACGGLGPSLVLPRVWRSVVEMMVFLRIWVQDCCVWGKLHGCGVLPREVNSVPFWLGVLAWEGGKVAFPESTVKCPSVLQ